MERRSKESIKRAGDRARKRTSRRIARRRRVFTRHSNTSFFVDHLLDTCMESPEKVDAVREAWRDIVESDIFWDNVRTAAQKRAESREQSGIVEDMVSKLRLSNAKRMRIDAEFIPKRKGKR